MRRRRTGQKTNMELCRCVGRSLLSWQGQAKKCQVPEGKEMQEEAEEKLASQEASIRCHCELSGG